MQDTQKRKPEDKVNNILKNMACQLIFQVLIWIRVLFDGLVDFLASLYWEPKKEIIPPLDSRTQILLESATSLALKIRKRQLKSEELVNICIERIKLVNPIVNAVTDQRYTDALEEAKGVDLKIEKGISEEELEKKPFLGVPFTAKESYAVQGMLHTLGLVSRRHKIALSDAEAIKIMKDAGAIIVAITNVPEINKWQETRNMLFGQTNNPYHTGRTVGGSSGGEGALVSSVASPIGICSDIGGSTRMPAYYCGLFGHNPTGEVTNMKGATFRTGLEKNTMVNCGPVVKHSDDIIPIMKLLTAEKGKALNLDAPVDLKKLKYYYVQQTGDKTCSSLHPDIKNIMTKVVNNLEETVASGNPPTMVEFDGFHYMYKLWRYWMSKEPADFAYLLGNRVCRASGIQQLLLKFIGYSEFSFAAIMGLLDLQVFPQENEAWAVATTEKLKKELLDTLGSDGVLLFHSYTQPAPYHYTCFFRPYNFGHWAIFNVLRFPSTQVPLGLNSEGLPLGIQVVAAPNNDRLTIAVAKHLEKSFGGFVPPCNTISSH